MTKEEQELLEAWKDRCSDLVEIVEGWQTMYQTLARDSMLVMIALARMNGGELRVPDRIIVQVSDKDQIDTYHDDKTMEMVWKLKRTDRN